MCSERVTFDGIDRSAKLRDGETVAVDFTPEAPGEDPVPVQVGDAAGQRGRHEVTTGS